MAQRELSASEEDPRQGAPLALFAEDLSGFFPQRLENAAVEI